MNSVLERESSQPISTSILLKIISEISSLSFFGMSLIHYQNYQKLSKFGQINLFLLNLKTDNTKNSIYFTDMIMNL